MADGDTESTQRGRGHGVDPKVVLEVDTQGFRRLRALVPK
jgi:hypothetical protein